MVGMYLLAGRYIEWSSRMENSFLGKVEELRNIMHVLCRTLQQGVGNEYY